MMKICYTTRNRKGNVGIMPEENQRKGVKQLKDATPVDSGKTRESWDGSVEKVAKGVDIIFSNSNKTKTNIPIPILIRNGHVTGTGGYVPPNDFMTPVIKSIVKESSEKVKKVMTSGK